MLICENGKIVEVEETENFIAEEEHDKLDTLIQGLSSAKSITEIRELAKDILAETE